MTTTPRHTPAERCDMPSLVFRLAETLRRMQKRLAGLVADVGQGEVGRTCG